MIISISSLEKFHASNKDLFNQKELNSIKSGIYMWGVEQIITFDNLNNQSLNYLKLAINYDSKNKRASKFMKFHWY